jgi:predicted phage terminase large subunit-like protein
VLWALLQNQDLRVAIISYEHNIARRWGRRVRDMIAGHPELGLFVRPDLSAQAEWELRGFEGGVFTAGIGAALTGRPVDLMIIDDPIKDHQQADSHVYRERVWDWWTGTGSTRLGPGAPVLQVATRWHEADLAGQLLAADDGHVWRTVNIPAQADHRPEHGETDPLGRAPGEFMESTRRNKRGTPLSDEQWEAIKARVGSRDWTAMYQGRPSPPQGSIFKRDWWQFYSQPMWIERADETRILIDNRPGQQLIQSWDMAFKANEDSDYVVGQVWLKIGFRAYLLDQVMGRWTFTETCHEVRTLAARWPQATIKLVEDKANGTAVIDALSSIVSGLVPEEPGRDSKESRAHAVAPFVEARQVYLPSPELAPWVSGLIDECAAFGAGAAHDDRVDALTQAIKRLLLNPIVEGDDEYDSPEEYETMDSRGWFATPY